MAILTSDQIIGKRESVENKLFRIFPSDTPFISSLSKRTIDSTFPNWLEKELEAPSKIAVAEGADAANEVGVTQPSLRNNVTQILSRVIKVSRTADRVAKYGRAEELAEGVIDTGIVLMNALEFSCVGSKQTLKTSSPMEFAGAQAQIDATMLVKTGAAATPLSEANVIDALLRLYKSGAKAKVLMITPDDAQVVAGFANAAGRMRDFGDTGKITNVVNLYAGPNGTVSVSQNRVLAAGDSIAYNPENWKLLVLDGWTKEPLGKVGDSKRMQIVGEYSLQHNNVKASALIRRTA